MRRAPKPPEIRLDLLEARNREKAARDRADRAEKVLELLLEFEPALERYRKTNANSWTDEEWRYWDLDGMKEAFEARKVIAASKNYEKPVVKGGDR